MTLLLSAGSMAFVASVNGELWPSLLASSFFLAPLLSLIAYVVGGLLHKLASRAKQASLSVSAYRLCALYTLVVLFLVGSQANNSSRSLDSCAVRALLPCLVAHYLLYRLNRYKPFFVCPTEIKDDLRAPLLDETCHDGEDWTRV